MTQKEAADLIELLLIACPNTATTIAVLTALRRSAIYKRSRALREITETCIGNYQRAHEIPTSALPW